MRFINQNDKIAEVIEAGTTQFTAQCYELYGLPPLGSLVRTGDTYGIVAGATTSSLEPGRKPIARGRDEATEAAVYESSPQLSKLLRSEFVALVVGYKNGESIFQHFPPQPARIHGFVYLCQPDETREFSQRLNFLNMLVEGDSETPPGELIAAALRNFAAAADDGHAFLVTAGKELATLLSHDFNRLRTVLNKLAV